MSSYLLNAIYSITPSVADHKWLPRKDNRQAAIVTILDRRLEPPGGGDIDDRRRFQREPKNRTELS